MTEQWLWTISVVVICIIVFYVVRQIIYRNRKTIQINNYLTDIKAALPGNSPGRSPENSISRQPADHNETENNSE